MQIIGVTEFSDSQLKFAGKLLNQKCWQSIVQTGVPLIFCVAIWTNFLTLNFDEAPALLVALFDGLVRAIAVLSGIAILMMPAVYIKAQKEVRDEIQLRQKQKSDESSSTRVV